MVLSAFKKTEDRDSAIVRVYNPSGSKVEAALSVCWPVGDAYLVDLNEDRLKQVDVTKDNAVRIIVSAKKIVSIELVPARAE